MMNRQNAILGKYFLLWSLLLASLIFSVPAFSATSLQEEIDLGKKIDKQILSEQPEISDQAAIKDIDRVGQEIVKKGGLRRPQIEYHFRIIKSDDLNAFSTPGGYVYFTEHIWNVLRPDERAGVLAHEIAHADRRHAIDALSKLQRRSLALGVLLVLTGASETVGDVVGIANQLYTLKYSRGDENQADAVGVEYLHAAGMNPAGLLLSMRKIQRFEAESGTKTPTILATHPATKERLANLEQGLLKLGIPIPPENIETKTSPYAIGEIVSITGNSVEFTSSKKLHAGDIVWVMGDGWDYYYESKNAVPAGRIIVDQVDSNYKGTVYAFATAKTNSIVKSAGIFAPPAPDKPAAIAKILPQVPGASSVAKISGSELKKLERLLAVQVVWDSKQAKLINDNTGYVVVTDPKKTTGYVAANRPKYSYAPVNTGASLVHYQDPDVSRWMGTVISIGKSGKTIEILPNKTFQPNTLYDVAFPGWSNDMKLTDRIIGTATLAQTDKKLVLTIEKFFPGYSIDDVQNAFDVYEQPKSSK